MALSEKYASSAGAGAHDGTSEANAWSWAEMLTSAAAGDRVNFKGNHTLTGNANPTNSGTATSPIVLRGYASAIGDGYLGRTNGNGPLITTNMPTIDGGASYRWGSAYTPYKWLFESVILTSSQNWYTFTICQDTYLIRCVINNSGTGSSAGCIEYDGQNGGFGPIDCDLALTGASGGGNLIGFAAHGNCAINCRMDAGVGTGKAVETYGGMNFLLGCTIWGGTDLINQPNVSGSILAYGCTIAGASSDGLSTATGLTRVSVLVNNLFTDNSNYALRLGDAAIAVVLMGNRFDRNTSGVKTGGTNWLDATEYSEDVTSATQANEYESYAGDDFRLKSTSPARAIGLPLYRDIGALQHQDAGGGSGGVIGGGKRAGMQ